MKRAAALMIVLAMLWTGVFAWAEEHAPLDNATPDDAPADDGAVFATPAPTTYTASLTEGDESGDVKRLQARLGELYYLRTAADGVFGAKTTAAVREFQKAASLPETGVADPATRAALDRSDAPTKVLSVGAKGDDVAYLQEKLIALCYLSGKADGVFGDATTQALNAFQTANGLAVTGVADAATHEAIDEENAVPGVLSAGAKGDAVAALQNRLTELNYLDIEADGSFGDKTVEAVKAFQRDNGLVMSGSVDAATRAAIEDQNAQMLIVPLKRGDKRSAVKTLQKKLAQLGLISGEPDGVYGDSTAQAVSFVQKVLKAQGYDVSTGGSAGAKFQRYFYSDQFSMYVRDIAQGMKGVLVKSLQRRLSQLNCFDGDNNGKFGATTAAAVMLFQSAAGLPQTGVVDRATSNAMYAPNAPSAAHPPLSEVKMGSTGKLVTSLQRKLAEMGFTMSAPDGSYGDGTRTALTRLIKYLNTRAGMATPDLDGKGTLTVDFQTVLYDRVPVYTATKQLDDKDDEVERIQRRLSSLYYMSSGGVDGHYGETTRKAIADFQANNNLIASGVADQPTQEALFSAGAVRDHTEFFLRVSIARQRVYAYRHRDDGTDELVRTMICSTGLGGESATPRGVYRETGALNRWHYFDKFYCWAQYSFVIEGDVLFHSITFRSQNASDVNEYSLANLGTQASHGCVRLSVNDAKWIYNNCKGGTIVVVE